MWVGATSGQQVELITAPVLQLGRHLKTLLITISVRRTAVMFLVPVSRTAVIFLVLVSRTVVRF